MNDITLVRAEQLSKHYGQRTAVSGLSLELRQGEILGLLGPNGAGKTTTLKMLSGCLAPSSGKVWIKGIDLSEDPKLAKQAIGYLPERPPVYPELTVDEYLDFCARVHGVAPGQRKAAVSSAKRDAGLSDVGQRVIGNLSRGYQQRVGIAQAIVHRPPVIILDEPTVGLDPIQIREIRRLIRELAQGHSLILSSHILPEIQATCDRVVIIHQGRIVFAESMATVQAVAAQSRILLTLKRIPAVEALRAVSGVAQVELLADGRVQITSTSGQDPREALVARAVAEDWGLLEIALQHKTLEEIFVELTARDSAATQEAA
ncbi:MAG: ABC transporter ATP-binding protein [Nevskiales bacterium]